MNAKRSGDIRVIGLVAGTHVIEDLGRDVPHGQVATIPGELAVMSKDLWRGISSKCLMQLPSAGPPPQLIGSSVEEWNSEKAVLEAKVRNLSENIRSLEIENERLLANNTRLEVELQAAQAREAGKLDSILSALQNGIAIAGPARSVPQKRDDVVDGSAPTFLPSEIRPRDVDARIDIQAEQSDAAASSVTSAAERLRQIKRGST